MPSLQIKNRGEKLLLILHYRNVTSLTEIKRHTIKHKFQNTHNPVTRISASRVSLGEVRDLSRGSHRNGSRYGEDMGTFRGFKPSTIATCQDGLKNSRDKSATSPSASRKRKSVTSATRKGEVSDIVDKSMETSWVCRKRHGKVGIVDFGLNEAEMP